MHVSGRRNGFTLVELVIVVVILGTLFAVGIPAYHNRNVEPGPVDGRPSARVELVAPGTYVVTSPLVSGREKLVTARLRELGCSDIRPIANQQGFLTGAIVRCDTEEAR